eukprot:scaffold15.g4227.t1
MADHARSLVKGVAHGVGLGLVSAHELVARVLAASLEGIVFAASEPGHHLIVLAELLAFTVASGGPGRPVKVALRAALGCALGRTAWVLGHGLRRAAAPAAARPEGLQSYCCYASHEVAYARGEVPSADPSDSSAGPSAGVAADAAALAATLAAYRRYAVELCYTLTSARELGEALRERGFSLLATTHDPDLDTSCPAWYLALSEARKEVLVAIRWARLGAGRRPRAGGSRAQESTTRGTYSPEDVFADLLGAGAPLGAGAVTGHSGMVRGAVFLGAKLRGLLGALAAAGLRVTVVGHSLSAGVAALLAVYLRDCLGAGAAGALRCYGYETPACMDLRAARACAGLVTSLVHGDDVVPRVIQRLGQLLKKLPGRGGGEPENGGGTAEEAEAALRGAAGQVRAAAAAKAAAAAAKAAAAAATVEEIGRGSGVAAAPELVRVQSSDFASRDYHAHVPGTVLFMHRLPSAAPAAAAAADGEAAAAGSVGSDAGRCLPRDFEAGGMGYAVIDNRAPALRRIRLTSCMIMDHFIDRQPFIEQLDATGKAAAGEAAAGEAAAA